MVLKTADPLQVGREQPALERPLEECGIYRGFRAALAVGPFSRGEAIGEGVLQVVVPGGEIRADARDGDSLMGKLPARPAVSEILADRSRANVSICDRAGRPVFAIGAAVGDALRVAATGVIRPLLEGFGISEHLFKAPFRVIVLLQDDIIGILKLQQVADGVVLVEIHAEVVRLRLLGLFKAAEGVVGKISHLAVQVGRFQVAQPVVGV